MKIKCIHGYFIFEDMKAGEVSAFEYTFDTELSLKDGYFTFSGLLAVPEFSLKGKSFMGLTAKLNYSGQPWEIFRANGFVYDFRANALVDVESVSNQVSLTLSSDVYRAEGLIQAGSVASDGSRITDYVGFFSNDRSGFRYGGLLFD